MNERNNYKALSSVITCGNWLNFENEIKKIEEEGIEYIHVDVMDGIFVPNFMLGTDIVKVFHKRTEIPLDVHLMITEPERKISYFNLRQNDQCSFHLSSTRCPNECITQIRSNGSLVGISLSYTENVNDILPFVDDIDFINVVCVRPGFPGQKIIPGMKERVKEINDLINKTGRNILLEVDGNVDYENAKWMTRYGANIFAIGKTGVYAEGTNFHNNVLMMRKIINNTGEDEYV